MNIFIVYWHPEPQSFNAAMRNTAETTLAGQGHTIRKSDLHTMAFDPVSGRKNFTTVKDPTYFKQQLEEMYAVEAQGFASDISGELEKIDWCDLMIWQFPLWWFGLPAMLKGWVDRVFAMGRVYGDGHVYTNGVFCGKKAMLSLTTGGPETAYVQHGFNGEIHAILRPIHRGMLHFVGFSVLAPHIVYGPAHLSQRERQGRLDAYAARLGTIFNEEPIPVGAY